MAMVIESGSQGDVCDGAIAIFEHLTGGGDADAQQVFVGGCAKNTAEAAFELAM